MNRVAVPTLLVAAMWIIVSLTTSVYLHWLNTSYQADIEQHVRCVESAGSLLEHLWHLQADAVDRFLESDEGLESLQRIARELQEDVSVLSAMSGSAEHDRLVEEIGQISPQFLGTLQPLRETPLNLADDALLRQSSGQLADRAVRLRELHHELLRTSAVSRSSVSGIVFWIRGVTLLVGPLLGWWMARRLGRVVNEIRVTLESEAGFERDELGAIQFRAGDDLALIRRQVEIVVERLRTTAEDLKRANHEVLRSDRLAAIGRLAAGVAHELRNPLTSVKLLIQFAGTPGTPPLTNPQLQLILEEIERMEMTIQGLLDLSRATPMRRTRHDLRETLTRAAQLVSGRAARQRVVLHLETGPDPLLVDGDVQQLHQVCVNLYLNAIESMPDGGAVRVRARIDNSSRVHVEIRDTGHGIRDDLLPALFEPFVTTKERGTGLGLAISQRVIENHDGAICAANAPEGGAVFEIDLPRSSDAAAQASPQRPAEVLIPSS